MTFFCVLSVWMFLSEIKISTTDEISSHGYIGQYVIISCSHSFAQNNWKYFCRDPCNDRDVLVSSDQSPNRRFTLKDFRNGTFTVTISDLQKTDSGTYWCGVDRVGIDSYNKVTLKVSKGKTETHKASLPGTSSEIQLSTPEHAVPTPSTTAASTLTLVLPGLVKASSPADVFIDKDTKAVPLSSVLYAVGVLTVMVTVFAVGLVCVCCRKKRVQTARCVSETSPHTDNEYKADKSDTDKENDPDERSNAVTHKSKKKTKDFQSQSDPVYQNLHVNTRPADAIYNNLL